MANLMRFGRRLALPSTRQIRHELVTFGLREDARLKDIEDKKQVGSDPASAPVAALDKG